MTLELKEHKDYEVHKVILVLRENKVFKEKMVHKDL